MLTLVIGNKNYSSWSLRPWLALAESGLPFEEVVVALDRPDTAANIAKYSPSGRVPALLDGDLTIWESLAICEYIAEKAPHKQLWPADPKARALARAVSSEMHSGFAALRSEHPMNIRQTVENPKPPSPAVEKDIDRITQLWSDCRARHGAGGPLLFGQFTIADAMFAPVVSRFRTYGLPLEGEAKRYGDALWNLPSMQAWVAAAHKEELKVEKYERK